MFLNIENINIYAGSKTAAPSSLGVAIMGALATAAPDTQTTDSIEWYPEDLPERMTWAAAKEAVEKLGDGWRVPSAEEWSAEIDRTKFNPALRAPSKFPGIMSDGYWTSAPAASDLKSSAWVVDIYYGGVNLYGQNGKFWVRPCRARRAPSQ